MKKILAGFFGLLIMTAAGLLALPFFLDVNDYRDFLSEKLSQNSGYHVALTGPLSLTFLPNVHLTANNVTVGVQKNDPFVHLDRAVIRMDLWPLLHKQVVVHTIEMAGPTIRLIEDKTGKNNWSADTQNAGPVNDKHSEVQGGQGPDFHLDIKKIHLQKGNVSLDLKGKKQTIADINVMILPTGKENPFAAMDVSGSFNYQKQSISFQISGSMDRDQIVFDGTVKTPDHAVHGKGTMESWRHLKADLRYQGIKPTGAIAVQNGTVHLSGDMEKKSFQLNNLSINLSPDRTVSGTATLSLAGTVPFIVAQMKTDAINVNDFMDTGKNVPASSNGLDKKAGSGGGAPSSAWPRDPISFDFFKAFDGRFTLDLPKVTYDQITLSHPHGECSIKGGKLTLTSLTAGLWGGNVKASGSLSPAGAKGGAVSASLSLKDITATDVIPAKGAIYVSRGKLNLNAAVQTKGESVSDFVSHLNGMVSFKLTEGVLSGVDVDGLAKKVTQKITPELIFDVIQKPRLSGQTSLEQLDGALSISNGIGVIQSLILKTKTVDGRGNGKVFLPLKTADIGIAIRLRDRSDWPGILVRLSGPWEDLKHDIDTKEFQSFLMKKTLKTVLKSGLDQPLKKALDGAGLGDILDKTGLNKLIGGNEGQKKDLAAQPEEKPLEQILDNPEKAIGGLLKGLF